MRCTLIVVLQLSLLLTSAALAAIPETVKTDAGELKGASGKDASVRVFKGVPFAAPPVGENRWRAPQPVAQWDGARDATKFSGACSAGTGGGGKGKGPAASEDCLYLNVWTAADSAKDRRPVFVWSYGGGFYTGSGSSPQFDGEALAKQGAVVVTYNYRLGVFGFFSHPELTKESGHHASGNYGLMDLAAALKWVKANIAQFGGDPGRVTIIGESAGSILGSYLVASPEAKGLFHRAIGQSGGWLSPGISKPRTLAEAEAESVKAAGGKTLAQLRSMSTSEVGQALTGLATRPIIDGWMIREDPSVTFSKGRQNKVDVLLGSNLDEGTFPGIGPAVTPEQAASYGPQSAEFASFYPFSNADEAAASGRTLGRDLFGWQMRTWAQTQAKAGNKAYLYFFTRVAPGQEARGATHGAEIPYVFGNAPGNNSWVDADRQLSEHMMRYWINFAATGNPNGNGLPQWPQYDARKNDAQAMVLNATQAYGPQIAAPRLKLQDQLWARMLGN